MAGAAAVVSVTGSLPAFAADQKDVPMVGDVFVFTEGIFDPLQSGKNTGGATSRTLPHFPIKSDGGKIVVSDVPSGYVGVKRGF